MSEAHHPTTNRTQTPVFAPILVLGFAWAITVWCAWFITHIPWMGISEQVASVVVLVAWLLAAVIGGRAIAGHAWWKVGLGAGALSAGLGLLLVGTRLQAKAPGLDALAQPNVPAIVGGFLALGVVIGLSGTFVGSRLRAAGTAPASTQTWLARMGVIVIAAIAPLLFIGGLVTSTNAGMAVPDWPNTYGANMFLYPLRPDIAKGYDPSINYIDIFLEHSHRLFGTFAGLSIIALFIFTLIAERRRGPKLIAMFLLVLVIIQGVLGGKRVLLGHLDINLDNRWWAVAHGVLAQLVLATAVWLTVALTPTALRLAQGVKESITLPRARILRICATGAMHATILQLVFGAMYRHLRAPHALYSHIGFAFVVLVMAMLAGIAATAAQGGSGLATTLRRVGTWTLGVVTVQFTLGWVAFLISSSGIEAQTVGEALVRTAHQANGALFLALVVALMLWAKRAIRAAGAPATA